MNHVTTAVETWPRLCDAPRARVEEIGGGELVAAFRSHYGPLSRLAYLIVGDSVMAEDVVQEAFLRTFAGWHRVREPHRVAIYLRRAVINLSRSRLRSRGVELRANALYISGESCRPDPTDVESASSMVESASAVVEAVRRLPDRQRSAVLLRYYLDLPEAEIAATLRTTVGTVKSQLFKARRTLGRVLEVSPGE